jgi:thiol:disulfide interchange protein
MLSLLLAGLMLAGAPQAKAAPIPDYDPQRDPAQDLKIALAEARRTGRRVLLDVGGKWCSWCRTMDRFFDEHPGLLALREKNFVMLKVNYSPENKNEAFLGQYPKIPGYPHLFVLDSAGKLLHSQDTGALELGKSYDLEKFTAFLKQWAPGGNK